MSKSYGQMCSYDMAITWAEQQPDSTVKPRALARMMYERDKALPVKPRFHKGRYGKKYDTYTCGNCGYGAHVGYNFCPCCGFAIDWRVHERQQPEALPDLRRGGTDEHKH